MNIENRSQEGIETSIINHKSKQTAWILDFLIEIARDFVLAPTLMPKNGNLPLRAISKLIYAMPKPKIQHIAKPQIINLLEAEYK